MSTIEISDLHPAGSALFSDSETYLAELTEAELSLTYGGIDVVTTLMAADAVVKGAVQVVLSIILFTGLSVIPDPGPPKMPPE
jgi:hypothetical protein